ncbi:MAG: SIMPL domain-containing protein, partial [Methylobacteriaceae bacterium]|nr:SIMPL domain-containing protein [Methylobacteriaceae bacterium]
MRKLALFATAFSLVCVSAFADDDVKFPVPHISVEGYASVEVKPDQADLSLGVVDEQPTAAAAVSENAKLTAAVIADLKTLAIDGKDIQTRNINVSPVFREDKDPGSGLVRRTLTGYRVSNILIVRIHDIDRTGSIVSHVIERGANTIQGLFFSVSDADARLDELRAKAVRDAKRRAA